jgi:hypothetical protein
MKHISTKQMFGRYGGTFGMASFYPSRGMPNRNVGRQGFEKINIRNCDCTKGFAHGTRGPSRRILWGDNAYTLQSASPGFDRGIFAAARRRDRRFRTIRPESRSPSSLLSSIGRPSGKCLDSVLQHDLLGRHHGRLHLADRLSKRPCNALASSLMSGSA